jgi:hypothetical protein
MMICGLPGFGFVGGAALTGSSEAASISAEREAAPIRVNRLVGLVMGLAYINFSSEITLTYICMDG